MSVIDGKYMDVVQKYTYTTFNHPKHGGYIAYVDAFPELSANGTWPAQARENLQQKVLNHVLTLAAEGKIIPLINDTTPAEEDTNHPDHYMPLLEFNIDNAANALMIAAKYGTVEGEYHKSWVLDQIIRSLTGKQYEKFIEKARELSKDPDNAVWDEGTVP